MGRGVTIVNAAIGNFGAISVANGIEPGIIPNYEVDAIDFKFGFPDGIREAELVTGTVF